MRRLPVRDESVPNAACDAAMAVVSVSSPHRCPARPLTEAILVYEDERMTAYEVHPGGDCEGCLGGRFPASRQPEFCPWCGQRTRGRRKRRGTR